MTDLSDTIKAKSDQLNADDLVCGPITVKLLDIEVDRSNAQQPWKMVIDGGHQPYMPCLSMRRVFIHAWGDDGTQGKSWIGRSMRLFRDGEVKYAGLKCGGLRISHLSDLPQTEMAFVVTIRKGAKGAYIVKRLDQTKTSQPAKPDPPTLTESESTYVADCTKEIASAETLEALGMIVRGLAKKSDAVKDVLRPLYAARKAELTPAQEQA
jgi:hypothetical protein